MNEVATLAGGCFWCTEAIFKRLDGVLSVEPGYSGGFVENPTSEEIYTGTTGHAESIQITFDPTRIPYSILLDIFFHTHNPTTLNQQGNDVGPEYRSAIFYHSTTQKEIAEKTIASLEKEKVFSNRIVTEVTAFTNFYNAPDYHKNYFEKHEGSLYCDYIISPKIHKLLETYASVVKKEYRTKTEAGSSR